MTLTGIFSVVGGSGSKGTSMWGKDSRDSIWNSIDRPWDVIVIGGGGCGAGIFNYAARAGLRVLLVDENDFAFGASGRTGKQYVVIAAGDHQFMDTTPGDYLVAYALPK